MNQLDNAQLERLALLSEEAAEVIHIVSKILRHGYNSYHPHTGENNKQLLEKELGDLKYAINLLINYWDISEGQIEYYLNKAQADKQQYLHYN